MTDQIISHVRGNLGHITLNRPKALNALTLDMCVELTRLLLAWEKDDTIGAVLIDGAGDRAFCAGGDVILLHDSGKAGDDRAEQFWRTEYALNELIHRYSKPYITLIDGFVMGGGVGLSVHGQYRIAGDNTLFAMPETGIGYFPDVGGTYFLPRLGMDVGQWLGLTGARLNTAQSLELGVANGFIPTEKHEWFIKALSEAALDGSDEAVISVMDKFQEAGPMDSDLPGALAAFNEKDVPSILRALDGMDGEWAAKQAATIRKKSPLALSVTFEAIKRGLDLDFRTAMTQELDLSLNFLKTQDFYEGIRAQLIDKDRNPKWSHDSVETVSSEQVERLFRQTADPRQAFLD
ncbi:enoyl-CoA hydratase [Litorimonas taeanensis]|uniref:3-hydroxyisobutyryl-CoA hydrolase n=1 Tax=Litorimonas taeanensis TaxID=568099 RepID=A0A420WLQ0_9PROT|nr:enoyl-CoA hydratase/isomerase family protein [Litorimonas taeanensis]RKQ71899.1 enoyl-CoA hydratase [Litorimonas taeanensis]